MQTDKYKIVKVKNPFDRNDREVKVEDYSILSVKKIVEREGVADLPVKVAVNGVVIKKEDWADKYLFPNDVLTIVPEIQGGHSGKNILRIVSMIVVAIVAWEVAPVIATTGALGEWAGATWVTAAVAMGINIVGGMIVNALLPPPKPQLDKLDTPELNASPNYGWSPHTTQQPGIVVPKIYGTIKTRGNLIDTYISHKEEKKGEKQYLHLLIALGMGPVYTITDYKINNQPVENFHGVWIHSRKGYQTQTTIPGFNNTITEYPQSNSKVLYSNPVIYQTQGNNYDALSIEITFPRGLYQLDLHNGDKHPLSVNLRVSISDDGGVTWKSITHQTVQTSVTSGGYWSGGFWTQEFRNPQWFEVARGGFSPAQYYNGAPVGYFGGSRTYWRWIDPIPSVHIVTSTVDYVTIKRNRPKPFTLHYRFDTGGNYKQYWVKIERLTADRDQNQGYYDEFYFTSIKEIYYDDFEYPHHALVGIKALATDQLSGTLNFSCKVQGALVRVYDGANWSVQYSNNPAWVCYDILTQPVFDDNLNVLEYEGYDPSQIDYQAFYEWAQECSNKGLEFNGIFDSDTSVWDAALKVAEVGRAILYTKGSKITCAVFKKQDTPVQIFSVGNILMDSFEETFVSLDNRAGMIEIDYLNKEKDYERDRLVIVDETSNNPNNKVTLKGFGITSKEQAYKYAKLYLYKNKYLTRSIKFKADVDAIVCTLGDRIDIQHDIPSWGVGGRIVSATSDSVTLDKEVTIESGKTYVITIRLKDNTLVTKTITNGAGTYTTLNVSSNFTTVPEKYDLYIFGEQNIHKKPFIVTQIDVDQDQYATIYAIEYNESIFNVDTEQPVVPTINYSTLNPYPPVVDVEATELWTRNNNGQLIDVIDISWTRPHSSAFRGVKIYYQRDNSDTWEYAGETLGDSFRFPDVIVGSTYTFAICTINTMGLQMPIQDAPQITVTAQGKNALPSNVTGFTATVMDYGIVLSWDAIPDADLDIYELSFDDGTVIAEVKGTKYFYNMLSTGTYTFRIRARDTSGNYSSAYTTYQLTIHGATAPSITGSFEGQNYVLSWTEPTAGDFPIVKYEIRYGNDWTTGTVLAKTKSTKYTGHAGWSGTRTFFIAAIDAIGNYGAVSSVSMNVQSPSAVSVTAEVIDNFALLKWTEPTTHTLPIDVYEVRKGSAFSTATVLGKVKGTFHTVFESSAGNYTYWVVPIDTAGNYGTETSVTVAVAQPPDFKLNVTWNDDFSGTKTNAMLDNGVLYAPVNTTETYEQHFINNGWSTWQDAINAGYNYYLEPTPSTASYEQTFDYGALLNSSKITVSPTKQDIDGTVSTQCTISVSSDNVNWTDYINTWSVYATQFRYVKVKIDFSTTSGADLCKVTALNVRLDSKLKNDAGRGYANASDTNGTFISFNETFVDIESIVITPEGSSAIIPVYDFNDVPYPTGFNVYLFDTNGNRVNGYFRWTARGY